MKSNIKTLIIALIGMTIILVWVFVKPPSPTKYSIPMREVLAFSYDYRYIYEGEPVTGFVVVDKGFGALDFLRLWQHTKTWPVKVEQLTFTGSQIANKLLREGIFIVSGKGNQVEIGYRKFEEEFELRKYIDKILDR